MEQRALRFAFTTAIALVIAYGFGFPLPFLAPLFAVFIAAMPGPPMGGKALLGLLVVLLLTLTVGVLLIPLIRYYPGTAVLLVGAGLYLAMYITLVHGKRLVGTFLTVGLTLISVAGSVDTLLATTVITSLALSVITAVVALWIVYPVFPDRTGTPPQPAEMPANAAQSSWLALRTVLIVMPAYLLALINPSQYLMTIMKSVSLGQQASLIDARHAGRELLGSTFVAGFMALAFWALLRLAPTLWIFFLGMLAFALFAAARIFGVVASRVAPSFWINAVVTMLILLGPAVEDSANGSDAWTAFLQRFATFIGVTLYAWAAIAVLERWRERRQPVSGVLSAR